MSMIDIVLSQHHHLIPLPFHKVSWWYKGYFYIWFQFQERKISYWIIINLYIEQTSKIFSI